MYYLMIHGEKEVMKWARRWKADAIIAQFSDVDVSALLNLKIPIIVQNYRDRIPGVCNLTGDYVGTGHMAAEYLVKQGFKNFAYYGIGEPVWSRERFAGFQENLTEKGFTVHRFFEMSSIKESWAQDFDKIGKWLKSLPKPVALFACDDYYALHISETCKIYDIQVPDEVAILGVDNDELLCNISTPPLSSIHIDAENGGYTAGHVLHELIQKNISVPFNISVPPLQVIGRESTEKYVIKDKFVLQTIEYIGANYTSPISVSDLLKLVPISRRVFEKRFLLNTGTSIYQFIQNYRIERFASKLITTDRTIEDLAISCGFEDYKNISRVFMRYKLLTPSQFRSKHSHLSQVGE
jgi:LacI family transcriptional regulator